MGAPLVGASESLKQDIQANFIDALTSAQPAIVKYASRLFDVQQVKSVQQRYVIRTSAPNPKRLRTNQATPQAGMSELAFVVDVDDWGVKLVWKKNSRTDDQSKTLIASARQTAKKFTTLPFRLLIQVFTGATNKDLLGAIPSCPDGLTYFTTSTRYATTGGNIVSGDGISQAGIETNYWEALERAAQWKDTTTVEPLLDESERDEVFIIHPAKYIRTFAQAFRQKLKENEAGTAGGLSNLIQDVGNGVTLIGTPYLTGDDWFVTFPNARHKALVKAELQTLEVTPFDQFNSDQGRDYREEGLHFVERYGIGVPLSFAIKIDN